MRNIAFIAALPWILLGTLARAQEEKPRTITSSGQAVMFVVPDEVTVSFGVETYDPSLDKSKGENDRLSTSLVKAIKGLGVEDKYIQADTINIAVRARNSEKPSEGIDGYQARRSYLVRLRDVKLFEKLIDVALKNGANRIYGLEYRTSQLRKYRDESRKMAIKAAREKAVALSSELECKIGKPRTISEQSSSFYCSGDNNSLLANNVVPEPAPDGGDAGQTMPVGQIAIRADVNVVFDLQPQ
jgi:uncharacterized protein YggE